MSGAPGGCAREHWDGYAWAVLQNSGSVTASAALELITDVLRPNQRDLALLSQEPQGCFEVITTQHADQARMDQLVQTLQDAGARSTIHWWCGEGAAVAVTHPELGAMVRDSRLVEAKPQVDLLAYPSLLDGAVADPAAAAFHLAMALGKPWEQQREADAAVHGGKDLPGL